MSVDTAPDLTVARRLLQAADTDIAAFFGFFTDETRFRMGNSDIVTGRDAIMAWVGQYLGSVAGMKHEVLEEFYNEDTAALQVTVTYTMASGASFTLPAITRTRIQGDKVVEYLVYMDPSPVAEAS
ncbi:nuclear transport factor 2 family protein [Pseudonocardia pini]|uniref:nuclear transport factor 2 family protein n=1 Tax=Pseudonocardia pini TaxID=2758030 RepID=UPI0015F04A28|nr:nuclear transport factor 2 family protein [Pseudonocardia pini]